MNWQTKDSLPLVGERDRQIIIGTLDGKSKSYDYNVVFYYEPANVWYGGPGIEIRDDDIEYWSEIQAPDK